MAIDYRRPFKPTLATHVHVREKKNHGLRLRWLVYCGALANLGAAASAKFKCVRVRVLGCLRSFCVCSSPSCGPPSLRHPPHLHLPYKLYNHAHAAPASVLHVLLLAYSTITLPVIWVGSRTRRAANPGPPRTTCEAERMGRNPQ